MTTPNTRCSLLKRNPRFQAACSALLIRFAAGISPIWFHGAVYDPLAADNEERSAELAQDWLGKAPASNVLIDSIGRLVFTTKSHDASLHVDAPLLADVDLSILGQPPEQFWEHERQIREEYSWVATDVFATRRAEIPQKILARVRIFNTEFFFNRQEA